LCPGQVYEAVWFDPRSGRWLRDETRLITVDRDGTLPLPPFPEKKAKSNVDWALKVFRRPQPNELAP
jgi:hypothetical protein